MEEWRKVSALSIVNRTKTVHLSCREELEFPPAPRRHVLQKLKTLKERHLIDHEARLHSLPYYSLYLQQSGHPPLEPDVIDQLRRDILDLEGDLCEEIESDWRACYNGNMVVIRPLTVVALCRAQIL